MSRSPTDHQAWAVLRRVDEAGGYREDLDETDAVPCVERGWLVAEGERGYGITYDGLSALRPLPG